MHVLLGHGGVVRPAWSGTSGTGGIGRADPDGNRPSSAPLTGPRRRAGLAPGPDPARAVRRRACSPSVEAWLLAEYGDAVRSTTRRAIDGGEAELSVALHPAAPDLVISAGESGRVALTAETETMGPGYHRFIGRLVERLGDGPVDHVGPRPGRSGRGPRRLGDDLRRPGRDRAWPTSAGSARRWSGTCRPGGATAPQLQLGIPGDDPLHVRRRDRHRPRTARRRVARGSRRPIRASRPTSRRGGPTRPTGRHLLNRALEPDVARGPLAPAGDQGRTRPARRGPPDPHPRLSDRPAARLPVARVGRADRAARHRRPDVPPGRAPRRARRRRRAPDRLPSRAGHHPPRGLGARDPRVATPSAGRPRSGGAAASGGASRSRPSRPRRPAERWAPRRSSTSSAATSAPTPSTIAPAAWSAGRGCRPTPAPASRSASWTATRRSSARRRDQDRVRRSGRLAVGARHVADARSPAEAVGSRCDRPMETPSSNVGPSGSSTLGLEIVCTTDGLGRLRSRFRSGRARVSPAALRTGRSGRLGGDPHTEGDEDRAGDRVDRAADAGPPEDVARSRDQPGVGDSQTSVIVQKTRPRPIIGRTSGRRRARTAAAGSRR